MTNNFDDRLDDASTTGRIKRYAKVTSAVGGLAAKLAGEKYLGLKIDKENHAKQLRDCLLYTSPSPRDQVVSRMPSSA